MLGVEDDSVRSNELLERVLSQLGTEFFLAESMWERAKSDAQITKAKFLREVYKARKNDNDENGLVFVRSRLEPIIQDILRNAVTISKSDVAEGKRESVAVLDDYAESDQSVVVFTESSIVRDASSRSNLRHPAWDSASIDDNKNELSGFEFVFPSFASDVRTQLEALRDDDDEAEAGDTAPLLGGSVVQLDGDGPAVPVAIWCPNKSQTYKLAFALLIFICLIVAAV